ncbi:MAG: hypothetical protein IKD53_10815, partial [Clostridia bacterium]|nr:hypothetical protein [Clostridia bacterium]
TYLTAIYGIEQGQQLMIRKLKEASYETLESIPVAGWFFLGIKIGKDFAVTFNRAFMNVDDVQGAAYKFEYAVMLGKGMKPAFIEAYENYMACPVKVENFEALYQASDAFGQFIKMEYKQLGSIASALDESLRGRIRKAVTGESYEEFTALCNKCADYYPTALTNYLNKIDDMMTDTSIVRSE